MQHRGTIPDIDDRDRFLADEVNPTMDETVTPGEENAPGRVQSLGKAGSGAVEGDAAAEGSGDVRPAENSGQIDIDSGDSDVLYPKEAADNPNGSGQVGIKDNRS
jgi:hypothetical protein